MVRNMLRRKLFRDMWKNRMQFVAVILLCALGSWVFSGLDAAWRMLELSSQTYFDQCETADLWVTLAGVDREKLESVRHANGVSDAQARATAELDVDLPGEPSLLVQAYDGAPRINVPLMFEGAALDGNDLRGCLLDRSFAAANGLAVGDRLPLELGSSTYTFLIRGLCMCGEFANLSKNITPDPAGYGFVIINSKAMPMLGLNSMVVTLEPGADDQQVSRRISALYPEALIVDRLAQSATHGIQTDIDMFRNLSYVFPLLAFAVSAMIVLTTITRMLENQRVQMGTLKALGYRDSQIRAHYLSYAFYPSLVGSLLGLAVGRVSLPQMLWDMETAQFTFPAQLQAPVSAAQWAVCAAGVMLSCLICLNTYRKSAREQTASLLRPKPPKAGRKLLLERLPGLWTRLGFNAKMIVRNLFRNKARTIMSLIGALCCTMLIITSLGLQDSVKFFVGKYYFGSLRYTVRADLEAGAGDIDSYRKRVEAERLEGEMLRSVSARLNGRARTVSLTVLEDDQRLIHLGEDETFLPMPDTGVLLTQKLMEALDAKAGDTVELWLAGDREPIVCRVSGTAHVSIGLGAYMSRSVWESACKGGFVPSALLALEPTDAGMRKLDELDEVVELSYPQQEFDDTMSVMASMTSIFSLMSGAALGLAFVVLYNMGMLNFMERYREYATLKVLGYHQKEIRALMSNENRLISGIGVLLGVLPGYWLTGVVLKSCESDTMVFMANVSIGSVLIACAVTFAFSLFVTALLTHKVKTIDMVEALKSVE